MVSNAIRRLAEKTFAHDSEFGNDALTALKLGQNLAHLGQNANRKPWEIAALKKIQQAHESGVVLDEV